MKADALNEKMRMWPQLMYALNAMQYSMNGDVCAHFKMKKPPKYMGKYNDSHKISTILLCSNISILRRMSKPIKDSTAQHIQPRTENREPREEKRNQCGQ